MRMQSIWLRCLLLVMCVFTLGMGGMGSDRVVSIPEPVFNYRATLVDQADVSMDLEKFSCEGQTYLSGTLGKAEISIDFEKIRAIFFLLDGKHLQANVNLSDGRTKTIIVDKKQPCYGASSYADVKIEMQHIKTITLHGKSD